MTVAAQEIPQEAMSAWEAVRFPLLDSSGLVQIRTGYVDAGRESYLPGEFFVPQAFDVRSSQGVESAGRHLATMWEAHGRAVLQLYCGGHGDRVATHVHSEMVLAAAARRAGRVCTVTAVELDTAVWVSLWHDGDPLTTEDAIWQQFGRDDDLGRHSAERTIAVNTVALRGRLNVYSGDLRANVVPGNDFVHGERYIRFTRRASMPVKGTVFVARIPKLTGDRA